MTREAFIERINERDKKTGRRTFNKLKNTLKETYDEHIRAYSSFQYRILDDDIFKTERVALDYSKFPQYEQALTMVTELIENSLLNSIHCIQFMTAQKIPFSNDISILVGEYYAVFKNFDPLYTNSYYDDEDVQIYPDTYGYNQEIFRNIIKFLFHAAFETNFSFLFVKWVEMIRTSMLTENIAIIVTLKDEQ